MPALALQTKLQTKKTCPGYLCSCAHTRPCGQISRRSVDRRKVQRRHGRSGGPSDRRLRKRWDRRIRWADARTGGESDGRTDGGSDDRRSGWTKRLWDALERPGGTVGRRTGGGSTAGRATNRRVEERLGQTHGRALTQFTPADPGRSLEFLLCT